MRRIITITLLFLSVFVVYGATDCDSIRVLFALNNATYNPALNNNASSMDKFIDGLTAAARSGSLERIVVYGYASPEGPYRLNERLAQKRCQAIADYLSVHAGIPTEKIKTLPGCIAWEGLRTLVTDNPSVPAREEVLRVLDKYLPGADTDLFLSADCRNALAAIDNGRAYKWMLRNLFPDLRYSLAIYTYDSPACIITLPNPNNIELAPPRLNILKNIELDTPAAIRKGAADFVTPRHRIALKTNLLYDAALLPNLELEWLINPNWSVSIEGGVAWWGSYAKEHSYRLVEFTPEVKRWIRPRAPWHGFYVGLFAGGGYYDFERPGRGWRGEGGMGGLAVGYMWPVGRNISLEAEIGAGYLYTKCKEYKPLDGHHVYQRTKDINYFGPLRAKFSFVWRLWDANKSRRTKFEQFLDRTYEQ